MRLLTTILVPILIFACSKNCMEMRCTRQYHDNSGVSSVLTCANHYEEMVDEIYGVNMDGELTYVDSTFFIICEIE